MRISVVIPTYNRRGLLGRALASVLAQTHAPDEVIVVDDGSDDGTAAWLGRDWPSVACVVQENRGVSAARNCGVAAAHGEWIAFLDSDDEWHPEKLERQLDALARQPDCPLCHTNEIWIRNGRRVNPRRRHEKRGGRIFAHCLPLCVISPSAAVIRRDILLAFGGFDEALPACEDYDLWLRLCARHPVAFVDVPLVVKHGGHDDQLSRAHWGMDRFRIHALKKILATHDLTPIQRKEAENTLNEKIAIYTAGARKRGRFEEAEQLEKP